jgi:hypothetical protein
MPFRSIPFRILIGEGGRQSLIQTTTTPLQQTTGQDFDDGAIRPDNDEQGNAQP